jgi:lipopolysaccharide transport system permease protein
MISHRALLCIRFAAIAWNIEMTDVNLSSPLDERPAPLSSDSVEGGFVDKSVHRIGPPQFSDLWHSFSLLPNFMPLFKVLVWRSITIRYSQSFLGVVWVAVQPIASTIMVFFMFNILQINTAGGAHQGVFLFSGIMTWQFFARGLQDSSGSLLAHAGILTKIYLPKIMLPFASVMAAWFDILIMIALLFLACLVFGIPFSPRILWLPVFLSIICFTALSLGIGLAPLNALYRDVGMLLPFSLQIGMFISPVYYATRYIPDKYLWLYHLNPMVTLLEGVRWSLLPESPAPDARYLAVNLLTIVMALAVSIFTYQKLESSVVDRI